MRFAIWLITVVAFAQDRPDCATAAQRLHSDSWSEKAWGAHLAAECDLFALSSDMAEQLVQANPEQLSRLVWDSEHFWMARAFLDALIRLRAPLGPDALKSIAKGYPDDAAILMLQHPYENQETLTWFRTEFPGGAKWVAASNELSALRTPAFAAALLRETTITHRFVVATRSREACCTGMAGSLMGALLTLKVPIGFPPIYFYRLAGRRLAGDEMLADGPAPIYMRRALLQPGIDGAMPGEPEGFCMQCLRIKYLTKLSGLPPIETEIAIEPNTGVLYANLDAELYQALERQTVGLSHLTKALSQSGALMPNELPIPVHIDVRLEDHRDDHTPPLPAIPSLKILLH